MLRKAVLTLFLLSSTLFTSQVMAGPFSANIGYNSQYIFRGIPQKNSSAMGGIDFSGAPDA